MEDKIEASSQVFINDAGAIGAASLMGEICGAAVRAHSEHGSLLNQLRIEIDSHNIARRNWENLEQSLNQVISDLKIEIEDLKHCG